ncbi:acid-sensing ion channel 4-B [Nephila pilipes]|uniref:Acid-sensing ion channel 4-B n=1 Tax=Nephila pilipes TaxID=299642 RepID=A0A8X6IYH3_NEPPI|nr:acid-sensing ion channel 4-B [Nephila pilipes]
MSSDKNYSDSSQSSTFYMLCRNFAVQSSAHGLRRAATARSAYTRIFWITVFVMALICCTFHCSFLVKTFLSYPRMTITEEIHADEISFPSITVCNLNIFKKSYIDKQFEMLRQMTQTLHLNTSVNPSEIDPTAFCYKSIDEFLYRSKTVDLSDIWMSLTVTKDSLQKFGHQEEDLIIHCTYNARNCYNRTYSIVVVNAYPSPRYGLCHTISVNQLSLQNVTTPGLALGLRLTLNIQREEYLNLLSPEYGARLLVHPAGTYPTLQRGGVVLQPGTKTYVSVRMRKIDRLPWPYGECTYEFEHSPLASHLRKTGQRELLKHRIYTYEYCQTLCRDAYLLKQCDCSEEITQGNSKFCDPCNITQGKFYFEVTNISVSLPEIVNDVLENLSDIRYDLTVSRSEWPNSQHQYFILKRWPLLREKFGPAASDGNYSGQGDGQMPFDLKYIRSNFLRVHVFIQEMNYLSVKDVPAYSTSQLFADLGGCLGLYIGVSLLTILEVFELFKSIFFIIRKKILSKVRPRGRSKINHVGLHWANIRSQKYRSGNKLSGLAVNIRNHHQESAGFQPRYASALRQLPSPILIKRSSNNSTAFTLP